MNWVNLVANRFSSGSHDHGKLSGLLSMVGMGVGCFALIISLSVMNGFESIVHQKLKGFEGDLRLTGKGVSKLSEIEIENVLAQMPFMERKGVIEDLGDQKVVTLKAIDEQGMISFYSMNLTGDAPAKGEIVIGKDLAYRLGKNIGDELMVYSPIDQTFGIGVPPKKKMLIKGIFSTKVLDYDDKYVFMTMKDGEQMFKRKTQIDGIDLRLSDNANVKQISELLQTKFGSDVHIQSWEDMNQSLVDAMKLERLGTILILSLIFLVATFNLTASLSLISIQKMKEIGILRSMGASSISIRKIMIQLGLSRAGKGAFYGIVFGLILVLIQNQFKLIPIPSTVYFIDALPMKLYISDLVIVISISFLFILLASYLSGFKLSKMDVKEALQWAK